MEIEATNPEVAAFNSSTGDGTAPSLMTVALEALAATRACSMAEVAAESGASNGDIAMDSLEAVCVVAALEDHLGRTLPGIEDLGADQIASVHLLIGLVTESTSSLNSPLKSGTTIAS